MKLSDPNRQHAQYGLCQIALTPVEQHLVDAIKAFSAINPEARVIFCGGWVRDKLLGNDCNDIDAIISSKFMTQFGKFLCSFDNEKNVWRECGFNGVLTIGACSGMKLQQYSCKGIKVDFREWLPPESLENDARTRDFTCNCLYYDPITEELVKSDKNILDLQNRLLNTVLFGMEVFEKDPGRFFRMVRFAIGKGFAISDLLHQKLIEYQPKMRYYPFHQIEREYVKLFELREPTKAFRMIQKYQLLRTLDGQLHKPLVYDILVEIMSKTETMVKSQTFERFQHLLPPKFELKKLFQNCDHVSHMKVFNDCQKTDWKCRVCSNKVRFDYFKMLINELAFGSQKSIEGIVDLKKERQFAFPSFVVMLFLLNAEEIKSNSPKMDFIPRLLRKMIESLRNSVSEFDELLWILGAIPQQETTDVISVFFECAIKEEFQKLIKHCQNNTLFPESNSKKEVKLLALRCAEKRYQKRKLLTDFWKHYHKNEAPEFEMRSWNNITFWNHFLNVLSVFDDKEFPATLKRSKSLI